MGWAGRNLTSTAILAAHWYWIGAIPAILFWGMVMMPFYIISKIHSFPEYLTSALVGEQASWPPFHSHFMTVLMSGRKHVRHGAGNEGCAGLEAMTFSIVVSLAVPWQHM